MKIAIPTRDFVSPAGHAGKSRKWLVYSLLEPLDASAPVPSPERIELTNQQVIHNFEGDGPHPLDGVQLILTYSAGDGFFRKMQQRGCEVLLTGAADLAGAVRAWLAGEPQPEPPFDITAKFCWVHDLFSRH
ncbi:MAG: hypothetical protein CGU28_03675 [Candidatus Dactylopiibacterium carminicum]|uniref:Dinitrogenase iron-molybdenum cofactor biosynthesis domain-containing protein n=1 Tax=Candidatus Dactylopiibacterium carminicum TaxID=857335 RepID=A0A272EZI4_9RHOO|nr:hypothetical protein [Candidatus Dactylopiibacterium carminicum]KAF7600419.1 hypothetical protein BGI27_02430 [Candidatus Dactylopiibacterium carminicum]PAS95040.1 MAG: hypothetical protein CGU29_00910 [Candidatus Dactylopiibacterium carminicum]PAS97851.1 MAG: hypothetical protein CGU28_03675 [Candidatus Dactylopiibacterium carminicum]PAT00418.1 MAG: hypothetical protein BSR46_02440 [Candidatus Dactylopiibacterium carminicum]